MWVKDDRLDWIQYSGEDKLFDICGKFGLLITKNKDLINELFPNCEVVYQHDDFYWFKK